MPAFSSAIRARLADAERVAVAELIQQIRRNVPAALHLAVLFGSKARGTARTDSDVDVLLVFENLPPDREPHASIAEAVAERVATRTAVPVTVWSVARVDLAPGNRTPMLVDALDDGYPLWPPRAPCRPLRFSPADALRCTDALLQRVREGEEEVRWLQNAGDSEGVSKRLRDDVVRLCTAFLLLRGITRPRRAGAARAFAKLFGGENGFSGPLNPILGWAAHSYGANGKDDERTVRPPPGGLFAAQTAVAELRRRVLAAMQRLQRR